MGKIKVRIQGNGIVTCFTRWEVLKRMKSLNESTWVQEAYQGDGFVGFNAATGNIDLCPGPTTIKLYEMPKNKDLSLYELHSFFRRKGSDSSMNLKDG